MGNSGQNFLDLLFGGVNKGVERFGQQKQQGVDLALTIQQMLQRQKQGEQTQANADRMFEFNKSQATAARMEGAGQQYRADLQQGLTNRQNAERLGLEGRRVAALETETAAQNSQRQASALADHALAKYRETQANNPGFKILTSLAPNFFGGFFSDLLGRPVSRTPEEVKARMDQFNQLAQQILQLQPGLVPAAVGGGPAVDSEGVDVGDIDAQIQAELERRARLSDQ